MLALAALLAGCTRPAVTGASPDAVTIRYDPLLSSRQDNAAAARAQCAAFGRSGARYVSTSSEAPLGFRYDTFACENAP